MITYGSSTSIGKSDVRMGHLYTMAGCQINQQGLLDLGEGKANKQAFPNRMMSFSCVTSWSKHVAYRASWAYQGHTKIYGTSKREKSMVQINFKPLDGRGAAFSTNPKKSIKLMVSNGASERKLWGLYNLYHSNVSFMYFTNPYDPCIYGIK